MARYGGIYLGTGRDGGYGGGMVISERFVLRWNKGRILLMSKARSLEMEALYDGLQQRH